MPYLSLSSFEKLRLSFQCDSAFSDIYWLSDTIQWPKSLSLPSTVLFMVKKAVFSYEKLHHSIFAHAILSFCIFRWIKQNQSTVNDEEKSPIDLLSALFLNNVCFECIRNRLRHGRNDNMKNYWTDFLKQNQQRISCARAHRIDFSSSLLWTIRVSVHCFFSLLRARMLAICGRRLAATNRTRIYVVIRSRAATNQAQNVILFLLLLLIDNIVCV